MDTSPFPHIRRPTKTPYELVLRLVGSLHVQATPSSLTEGKVPPHTVACCTHIIAFYAFAGDESKHTHRTLVDTQQHAGAEPPACEQQVKLRHGPRCALAPRLSATTSPRASH